MAFPSGNRRLPPLEQARSLTVIRFELKEPIAPTTNVWKRMHWARYRKLKTQLAWQFIEQKPPGMAPIKRARVHIVQTTCGVEPDGDNLDGVRKPVLDAMQDAGIIVDDAPEHLVSTVEWQRAAKATEQRTWVTVEAA